MHEIQNDENGFFGFDEDYSEAVNCYHLAIKVISVSIIQIIFKRFINNKKN
jgi:hypothetical protein